MIPERAQTILDFWFKETPFEMRFKKDDKFDQKQNENMMQWSIQYYIISNDSQSR